MNTSQGLVLTRAGNCTPVAQCSGMATRVPPHGTCHPTPRGAAVDDGGQRAKEQLRHGLVSGCISGCDFRKLRPQYFHKGTITPEGVHLEVWDGDRVIDVIDTRKPRGDGEPAAPRGGRIVI